MSTENTENTEEPGGQEAPEQNPSRTEALSSLSAALGGVTDGGDALSSLGAAPEEAPEEEKKAEDLPNPDKPEEVAAELLNKETPEEEKKEEEEEETPEEEKKETPEEAAVEDEEKKKEDEEKKEEVEIESPLFGGKKPLDSKKEEPEALNFENVEEVNKLVKDKTGFDDLQSLIDNSAETKEKLSNFEKLSGENEQLKNVFANMPTELYQAVDSFLKGNDWKTPIVSKPNLDFTKESTDQDKKSLVDNYFPGQFSNEEWEDYKSEEPDPGTKKAIDLAIQNAQAQFGAQKTELDGYRQTQIDSANEKAKAMGESLEASFAHLEQSMEGLDKGYISQLKGELTIQGLNEMFLNKDGTFKKEAAKNFVMAKHGFDLMEQYKGIATRRAESKEREKIIQRTPDKPKPNTKTEEVVNDIRPEVQQYLGGILDGTGKQKTY